MFLLVFGPPNVTLNCSADYVMLTKVVELAWKPTLSEPNTSLADLTLDEINEHIINCEAKINCNHGYSDHVSSYKYIHKQLLHLICEA